MLAQIPSCIGSQRRTTAILLLSRAMYARSFAATGIPFCGQSPLVRAVPGWSQTELGCHVGLTQRAIHKLEQGQAEPRRTTVRAIKDLWRERHIEFEELADGGFRASIDSALLNHSAASAAKPRSRTARA